MRENTAHKVARRLKNLVSTPAAIDQLDRRLAKLDQVAQSSLVSQWANVVPARASSLLPLVGFSSFSQFEEDGQILFILTVVGGTNRVCVELGAGAADQNMTSNLIVNHGWQGFLYDGSATNVASGTSFFDARDSLLIKPRFRQLWLEAATVEKELLDDGVPNDPDFMSIDVDGNDWWLFRALKRIRPRLLVVETHDIIPLPLRLTVPYYPDFCAWNGQWGPPDFRSASLGAWVEMMNSRGYRLIGSHRYGFNAYFMRDDVGVDAFPRLSPEVVHNNVWSAYGQRERWPRVRECAWEEV
jgi:hypothetical protein